MFMVVLAQIVQLELRIHFFSPQNLNCILNCLIGDMAASYLFLHSYVYELMLAQSLKEVLVC